MTTLLTGHNRQLTMVQQPAAAPHLQPAIPTALPPAPQRHTRKLWTLLGLLLLWQLLDWLNQGLGELFYKAILFPGPLTVLAAGWELAQTGDLLHHTWASLVRIVGGVLLAMPLSVLLAMVASRVRWLETLIEPLVEMLKALPILALLPIFILWLGIGERVKLIFIAYNCFFIFFPLTVLAVRKIDPVLLRAGQSLGLHGWQQYRYVILPAILPDVMAALRLSLAAACSLVVGAELIAAQAGLGYLINYVRGYVRVDQMLVAALILALIGVSFTYGLLVLEQRLFRWRAE